MKSVRQLFDEGARTFDRTRRQLIPCFDDFYGVALEQIRFDPSRAISVLDLGAGTGLLSMFVAERFPNAEITLIDIAEEMLAVARSRPSFASRRFQFLRGDFAEELPEGPFDVIVSGLAIHHLSAADKRQLYRRVLGRLHGGGIFVNADQVLGTTPAADERYWSVWRQRATALGATPADLATAIERMQEDQASALDEQLGWLRDAGFANADCWYKFYAFAVFSGEKPALCKR
jgi:tRNA (cmo5U34)-methyltransferase